MARKAWPSPASHLVLPVVYHEQAGRSYCGADRATPVGIAVWDSGGWTQGPCEAQS